MNKLVAASTVLLAFGAPALAQNFTGSTSQAEGVVTTQALVHVESRSEVPPAMANIQVSVDGKKEQLTGWSQVPAGGVQIAILIDDGLRTSLGRELSSLQSFVSELPAGAQVYIGYMRNGSVDTAQRFTTDHAIAAQRLRMPIGAAGISGSPYFCVSEFVKHWPADPAQPGARFVLMITNGVDPYNGSTSIQNQNSPYVQAALEDAQRAGVSVSSIYFGEAGFHGERSSFSGQGYLSQTAEGTGGKNYYLGSGNPVSLAPFLAQFQHAMSETFVASFPARARGKNLVSLKTEIKANGAKLRAPGAVQPGNNEGAAAN